MWVAEIYLEMLGTAFRVRATNPAYLDPLRAALEPFLLHRSVGVPTRRQYGLASADPATPGDTERVVAYRDCRRLGSKDTLGAATVRCIASLNRRAIDDYDGFALHAAVVAREGEALALPSPSGGGKSTLAAACVMRGFDYVSDEALCIDPVERLVVPYPKPLALSRDSAGILKLAGDSFTATDSSGSENLATPRDLGGKRSTRRTVLRHVVLPVLDDSVLALSELPASEAMAALLRFSFNHYKLGERAFRIAAEAASSVRAWSLHYHDPFEAAALLYEKLY